MWEAQAEDEENQLLGGVQAGLSQDTSSYSCFSSGLPWSGAHLQAEREGTTQFAVHRLASTSVPVVEWVLSHVCRVVRFKHRHKTELSHTVDRADARLGVPAAVLREGLRSTTDPRCPEGHAASHWLLQRLYLQAAANRAIPAEAGCQKFAVLQGEASVTEQRGWPSCSGRRQDVLHPGDSWQIAHSRGGVQPCC